MEQIIDIILWIIAISLFLFGLFKKNQDWLGLFFMCFMLVGAATGIVYFLLESNKAFTSVVSIFSLNKFILIIFCVLAFFYYTLTIKSLQNINFNYLAYAIIIWALYYIFIGLQKDISWILYGVTFLLLGLLFLAAEKYRTIQILKYLLLALFFVLLSYYTLIFNFSNLPFNITSVSKTIVSHHAPMLTAIVFIAYYLHTYKIINFQQANIILSLGILLFAVGSTYLHPDTKALDSVLLEIIEHLITFISTGIVVYGTIIPILTKNKNPSS